MVRRSASVGDAELIIAARARSIHVFSVVSPAAIRTERVAELRLGSIADVSLKLEPPAALVPDPLAEAADREHALEHLDLLPLPGDVADHLHISIGHEVGTFQTR